MSIKFSADQLRAFDIINDPQYPIVFLTGSAGTGKSTVVNNLKGNKILCATTGLAASIINGRTLHSLLSLTPRKQYADMEKFVRRTEGSDFIIIDEISMMSDELFDIFIECVMNTNYTGRVLLTGDFDQLPPVKGDPCYKSDNWKYVKKVELTEIHRQTDLEFIECLNDIKKGSMTPRARKYLKQMEVSEIPPNVTAIVPLRAKALEINIDRLSKIDSEEWSFKAHVYDLSKMMSREKAIEKIEKTNCAVDLKLKVGARVMTTVNYPDSGYVNGTVGEITMITNHTIYITRDDGRRIEVAKHEHESLNGDGKVVFKYRQFPLMLAWATTIHKSQGQSISRLYVDMSNHFEKGMTYVALSRAESPHGLFLSHVPEKLHGQSRFSGGLLSRYKKA